MGKGGGCVPSKKKRPPPADADGEVRDAPIMADAQTTEAEPEASTEQPAVAEPEAATEQRAPPPAATKLRIFIVFYSMYGHVEGLARRMKKGIDGVDGVEGFLYRVPETLPEEILEKMRAPPKDPGISEIAAAELAAADGVLFGFPTRYGAMAAQMKAFFDSTGQLWREQKLAGKPAGFFVSTGTQGGGQETTA